jgi:plastocyanin
MRKAIMITAGVLLASGSIGIGASAYASGTAGPKTVTVQIVGKNIFQRNEFITTTYRFPENTIKVHKGDMITFVNKTDDAHTMTLVRAADLPGSVAQTFNCTVCNDVNNLFGIGGPPGGLPAGVQIDNGKLTDDDTGAPDADVTDPAVPPGVHLPFPVLVQDFNAASHSNPTGPSTIGDSTLVDATGPSNHGFVTQRTVKVTAEEGTTLNYYCTIHPWMQGTIQVVG